MPNTNCLKGFKCPKCEYEDSFLIEMTLVIRVYDDGTDALASDTCWTNDSYCMCDHCSYSATVEDFTCSST